MYRVMLEEEGIVGKNVLIRRAKPKKEVLFF